MLKKNEYIEFDIELAKQGREVRTRSGEEVKILTFDARNEEPIVALVGKANQSLRSYPFSGRYLSKSKSFGDLVIMREQENAVIGYANLYANGTLGKVFATEDEAKKFRNPPLILPTTIVKIVKI